MALRSKKKRDEGPEGDEPEVVAADESTEAPVEGDAASDEPEEDELQRLERERGEFMAKWQRATADFQNLRRRLQTDIDGAVSRAKESLLLETLQILDYLEMALASPTESPDAQTLKYGVEMTRNQLLAMLEREGVQPIPVDGTFDPRVHDAQEVVQSDAHEPDTIVETTRKGYHIGDRTLRPAQVRVAGTPADEASDDEAASDEATD